MTGGTWSRADLHLHTTHSDGRHTPGRLAAELRRSRLSVVAYIAPCFAVVFGAVFRSEAIGAATVAGLLTVLAGSWLAARKSPKPLLVPEPAPVD